MTQPTEPATIVCRVCGTENPASRQFCRRCAADLRAPIPAPGEPAPEPPGPSPLRPILIGAGVAAAILALLVLAFALLSGGGPTATPGPTVSEAPSASPSAPPTPEPPTEAPTEPPATEAPATPPASEAPRRARIRSFVVPEVVDCADPAFPGTIHVSWEVVRATGVTISIDGPGVYQQYDVPAGEADVPFSCGEPSHSYLLTTVGGVGAPDTERVVVEASAGDSG